MPLRYTEGNMTKDEAIRDLAERAEVECWDLAAKMNAIIEGWDGYGDPETQRLCGIGRDKAGRAQLVFSEYGETNPRTVLYVDAILTLARLLNGEPHVEGGNDD